VVYPFSPGRIKCRPLSIEKNFLFWLTDIFHPGCIEKFDLCVYSIIRFKWNGLIIGKYVTKNIIDVFINLVIAYRTTKSDFKIIDHNKAIKQFQFMSGFY